MVRSLQDRFAPNGVCFGCGPKNRHGLRLKSVPSKDGVLSNWQPRAEHVAFGNFGSGGIISVLMDCQGNWASAYALMKSRHVPTPPGSVTAVYTVKFLNPSPIDENWELTARATGIDGDRVNAAGELRVGGSVTAETTGVFVAVNEPPPAFQRWR